MNLRHNATIACLTLLLLPTFKSSFGRQTESSTTPEKLDAVFSAYHESGQFNGTALVAVKGKILFRRGYGLANESWAAANDVDTRFLIASVSKVFTATAVMQLVEAKQVDLDSEIGAYLPKLRKDVANAVTVRQLLQHTSGVKREVFEESSDRDSPHSTRQLWDGINSTGLVAPPGKRHGYTNTAYTLLALIVESVTGRRFQDVVRERIFEPAKMNDSGFKDLSRIVPKSASGYDICINSPIQAEVFEPSNFLGAGGVYTTVEDLFRFDRALTNEVVLSNKTQRMMTVPGHKNWGLGWQLLPAGRHDDGTPAFGMFHNGDAGGFAAHFSRFPLEGFVLVMLCNQSELPRTKIFQQVANVVNGGEPRPAEPMAAPKLFPLILGRDFSGATETLHRLRQEKNVGQVPGAMHLLIQGNMLLRLDRVDDARCVFDFINHAFPKSAWGHLALGKLAEDEGDPAAAEARYRTVLKMDPKNPWAINYLAELTRESKQAGGNK